MYPAINRQSEIFLLLYVDQEVITTESKVWKCGVDHEMELLIGR